MKRVDGSTWFSAQFLSTSSYTLCIRYFGCLQKIDAFLAAALSQILDFENFNMTQRNALSTQLDNGWTLVATNSDVVVRTKLTAPATVDGQFITLIVYTSYTAYDGLEAARRAGLSARFAHVMHPARDIQ